MLQKSDDGDVRLRLKGVVTFTEGGLCKAKCHWCNTAVELPLELSQRDPRLMLDLG